MGIKITPADTAFSKCVRERANWTCQVCHTVYPKGSRGLECSHYYGRGNYSVRFDPYNAWAHCTACHFKMGSNPDTFVRWVENRLSEHQLSKLRERKNNTDLGKTYRKELKEIAAHYRDELKEMERIRAEGEMGYLEFQGYGVT